MKRQFKVTEKNIKLSKSAAASLLGHMDESTDFVLLGDTPREIDFSKVQSLNLTPQ